MVAKDYPVTYPYGATSPPYSSKNPHKGDDRSMPLRTPVTVNGSLIGLAGTTGNSTGVHTHTQKQDKGIVVNPLGRGFDVPQPTIVSEVGRKSNIGNYVRYTDASGIVWSVFHLDEIRCKVGDRLGVNMEEIDKLYKALDNTNKRLDALANSVDTLYKIVDSLNKRTTGSDIVGDTYKIKIEEKIS